MARIDSTPAVCTVSFMVVPNQRHGGLATYYISEEDKEYILHLKNSGKYVEAVKKVREVTSMDLVQAKQYVDTL